MQTVSSFDVFDTVVTRRVGAPEAVFLVVAERLAREQAIPATAPVFAELRRSYELRLIRTSGRQVDLRCVYQEVARCLAVDEACAEQWAVAEETVELELTTPIPGADRMIAEARSRGDAVVFVSDTPHTESFLGHLLRGHGLARREDRVFTSADRGVSKATGGLFSVVAAELGADRHFAHTGDNPRGDVTAPRVEGWTSTLVPRGQLSRYEKQLGSDASAACPVRPWLAGSARLARLEAVDRGVDGAIALVASGVVAPTLVGYAMWVAAQAQRLGIKRLYYAARDGEVMFKVARRVIPQVAPEIDVRYIHGSRQAWVLAASALSDEVLKRWLHVPPDATPRTMLRRVGLDVADVYEATRLPFLRADLADERLADNHRALSETLLIEPVLSMIRSVAAESATATTGYLRQVGLCDGTTSALVDSGWGGMTAHALDALLSEAGGSPVSHFFIGRTNPPDPDLPPLQGAYLPWLFDQIERPGSMSGLEAPTILVEMLCAGTEGRTIGYALHEDVWRPVFASPDNEPALSWGVEHVHEVAERVAELAAPHLPKPGSMDFAGMAWDLLLAFWNRPTDAEVATWGRFPWEEEASDPFQSVAEQVTTRRIARRVMKGDFRLRRSSTWRAGTARISDQPWRTLLRGKAWLDANRSRIRRAPRALRMRWVRLRRW